MLFRFVFASATMIILGIIKKIRLPKMRELPKLLGGGFVGIFLYMWFINTAMVTVESGITSFIIASSPVFTIILSRILLGEKMKLICWAGVLVSFCGLVVIMLSGTSTFSFSLGVLLVLFAAIATSFYNIIQRNLFKTFTALEVTTYCVLAATLFMLIYLPDLIRELPGSGLTQNLSVAYLGIFPAAIAYFTWSYALSKAEKTTHVTVFLYLMPFITSVLAYFWRGETLTIWSLFGGVVIIGGMIMANMKR